MNCLTCNSVAYAEMRPTYNPDGKFASREIYLICEANSEHGEWLANYNEAQLDACGWDNHACDDPACPCEG